MPTRLPKNPEQLFIDDVLIPSWDPSTAQGFDLADGPGAEGFLPVATSIDNVGETCPLLVVTRSNETSGGETTYDFMTSKGPGQQRDGQLLVTVRAEDVEGDEGYTGDSTTYSAVTAETIVDTLINEIEDICLENPQGGSTDFSYLGSQRAADAPDDLDASPPVRIEQCTVAYGWLRAP